MTCVKYHMHIFQFTVDFARNISLDFVWKVVLFVTTTNLWFHVNLCVCFESIYEQRYYCLGFFHVSCCECKLKVTLGVLALSVPSYNINALLFKFSFLFFFETVEQSIHFNINVEYSIQLKQHRNFWWLNNLCLTHWKYLQVDKRKNVFLHHWTQILDQLNFLNKKSFLRY